MSCLSAACASALALATKAILSYRLAMGLSCSYSGCPGMRRGRLYTLAMLVEMTRPAFLLFFLQRPDWIPIAAAPVLELLLRTIEEDRGRPVGGRRAFKTRRGEVEFPGTPMHQALCVFGDERLL